MPISVVIPVGPKPGHKQYLFDAINSVIGQTVPPAELFIVDDQVPVDVCREILDTYSFVDVGEWQTKFTRGLKATFSDKPTQFTYWRTPWLLGCAAAFNMGVALAQQELVFMAGSDDLLLSPCLEECERAYHENRCKDGWYNVTDITDKDEIIIVPNHSSMVTKGLWKLLGGFSPYASAGAPDALALSQMMVHMPDRIFQVKEGVPLYWVRQGDWQETRSSGPYFANGIINVIRDIETRRWTKPEWTK